MRAISFIEPGGAYCKGCSHPLVLRSVAASLESLELDPADVCIVTDVGCIALADLQLRTPHSIHTTHGRSTAFATGISLADAVLHDGRLKTIVLIGDGGATIGINHLINAALMNPDITVVVHNNFLYGMTGGQNSAFSPLGFVTATTRQGGFVPPLDLARLLLASQAPFVARTVAGDRELADLLARAVAHPGFAVVEVLELCTAYGVKWNELTGAKLRQTAVEAGYELGVLRDEARPTFAEALPPAGQGASKSKRITVEHEHRLTGPVGVVIAGTAGEGVRTAAGTLIRAAAACGLHATQKNDNFVTQGSGFSISEVILSPHPVLYTGIDEPDAVLVSSADGVAELGKNGMWGRVTAQTRVIADATLELPELPVPVRRLPLRETAGGKGAALAAMEEWLDEFPILPEAAIAQARPRR